MSSSDNTELKEKYQEQLAQMVPINALWGKLQNEITKNTNIVNHEKGSYVFKQGSSDNFAIYLLEGILHMEANGQAQSTVTPESDTARYALAQLQPRRFSARAKTDVVVAMINRSLLDKLIILQEKEQADSKLGETGDVSVHTIAQGRESGEEEEDWMAKMLQSDLFSKIPTANMYQLFEVMNEMPVEPKQVIIRQGEQGDSYYIIRKGKCAVVQKTAPGKPLIKVAELGIGESFGEESLVSKGMRNASVVMLVGGTLMRLGKSDFDNLIIKPSLSAIKQSEAEKIVEEGGMWLDVRFPSEIKETPTPSGESQNIPIYLLRKKIPSLDKEKKYVAICNTGERSSTAAFLLTQSGYNASYLKNGLQSLG